MLDRIYRSWLFLSSIAFMCVCVCVCVCVCMCVCVCELCKCVRVCERESARESLCVYTALYIHICMYISIHTYT